MNEFTIRVTESNGVVGIALSAPKESKPIASQVANALTTVLPAIVAKAVERAAGKCDCPDCQQERAAESAEPETPTKTLH